jgi:O-antigen ligase
MKVRQLFLEKRQMTGISERWWLLLLSLGVAYLLAWAFLMTWADDRYAVPLLLTSLALTFLAARRLPFPLILAAAIVTTSGTYRGALYASQIGIAGIVVTPLDLLWLYVGLRFIGDRFKRVKVTPAGYLLLAVAVLTAISGIVWDQPVYNIAKLFRTEAFLAFGLIVGANLLFEERILTLKAFIVGGTITALLQILTFVIALGGVNIWTYLGISASGSTIYRLIDRTATSSYRDNGVVINFAILGLIAVLGFADASFCMPSRRQAAVTGTIMVVGIILSLARSNWLVLIFIVALWSVITGAIRTRRFWQAATLASAASSVVLMTVQMTGILPAFDIVSKRFAEFAPGADGNTLGERALETSTALYIVSDSPIFGVGAADVRYDYVASWGEMHHIVRNQIHNGFVQFLVGGGMVALSVIVGVFVVAAIRTWLRAGKDAAEITRSIDRSLFLMVLAIMILSMTTGLINDFQQAVIAGLILGMALSHAPCQESKSSVALSPSKIEKGE